MIFCAVSITFSTS
jgi:drug/metabolite transporter (DMT)-like permease